MQPRWLLQSFNPTLCTIQAWVWPRTKWHDDGISPGWIPRTENSVSHAVLCYKLLFIPCFSASGCGTCIPGLQLLGFKPTSSLKVHHHIKAANFIYPDDGVRTRSPCVMLFMTCFWGWNVTSLACPCNVHSSDRCLLYKFWQSNKRWCPGIFFTCTRTQFGWGPYLLSPVS